ncbi:MAG: hypothetical protein ACR2NP_00930, partial [Pirellulaceae bacterium]
MHKILPCLIAALFAGPNWVSAQDVKPPVLDAEMRLAFHAQHLLMSEESEFKKMKWRFIGPELMSGRVTDIAVPAGQPFTFY